MRFSGAFALASDVFHVKHQAIGFDGFTGSD